jgi:hypothetical protein
LTQISSDTNLRQAAIANTLESFGYVFRKAMEKLLVLPDIPWVKRGPKGNGVDLSPFVGPFTMTTF